MLLDKLKRRQIRSKTNKQQAENKLHSTIKSEKKVSTILLLVDENVAENCNELLASILNIDVHEITTFVYIKKLPKVLEEHRNLISKKDINIFGKIKNANLNKIVNQDFDMLVNFTSNNLILNYLSVVSKSIFKVSLCNSDVDFYDLTIDVPADKIEVFGEELKKYLTILKKL